jgi:hypothetical protein
MVKKLLLFMLLASSAFGQNLLNLTTQAQGGGSLDAFLRGGSLLPVWLSIPDCHGGSNAIIYNASTHALGCNTITTTGLSGTQYSPVYMANSSAPGYATPPATTGQWLFGFSLSSDAPQAPTIQQVGLNTRGVAGATDTVLWSDNFHVVEYSDATSVSVSLPTATTLENPTFATVLANVSGSATSVTVTPVSWTINGASTLVLAQGEVCSVYVNPAGGSWHALCRVSSQHP